MNGRDRSRGPPGAETTPPQRDPRRVGDGRNGPAAGPGDGAMSRAEKFEDEKKRIITSCFGRKDNDGSLVESYITHVRITEDGAYPSTPPPPNSPPDNKKARVIVVAVRRSGRVRMHKARENNDGTFSIGKTWMLDDLSAIQSYNALVPSSPVEAQHKQWASNVGFIVTVGKPYYWHARTSKEKDFFIGSLVKIYRKYTGGKLPNLIGFDDRERQLLAGNSSGPPPGPSPSQSLPPPQPPSSSQSSRPQSPYSSRAASRDGPKRMPAEEQSLRSQKSREQMGRPSTSQSGRSGPPPFGPPQHPPPITPDQRDQPPPRAAERMPKVPVLQPPDARKDPPSSLSPGSKPLDESNIVGAFPESRPPSSKSGESRPALRTQGSSSSSMEVRRNKEAARPTTAGSESRGMHDAASSLVPPPLEQGSTKTSPSKLPVETSKADTLPRSGESQPVDMPAALKPNPSGERSAPIVTESAGPPVLPEPEPSQPVPDSLPGSPEVTRSSLDEDPDAHRPGLGPMIKKKPSKDVAGAFRKAATAYGAFKPRPGGAGERLLAAAKKQQAETQEPDGITGVVPAPFLRTNSDLAAPGTPENESPVLPSPSREIPSPITTPALEPPTVEVTQAATEEVPPSNAVDLAEEPRDTSRPSVKLPVDDTTRSVSPSPNGRRRRRHEDNTIKYCQALGIEPAIIEGRGIEFDDILTDLGWNGRLSDEKRIEDLESDIRREIGRVEATSWLGNLEQQEGKVEQLAKLIDKTIDECEELDNLLTLYSHELNTLNDDVSYIEAQSQGLQVQTANQKLLHNELQNLLKTLSISKTDLRPLKEASLSNPDGLKDTEIALATLYKAMLMIDSDIWQNKRRLVDAAGDHASVGVYADTEIGQMRAIKEKKEEYRAHSEYFLQRLKQFMAIAYKVAEQKRADAAANNQVSPMKLDSESRVYSRKELWMYHGLMLFAREISGPEWQGLITLYEQQAKHPYQNQFRDNGLAWKKAAKKHTGEEQELLFTHQEKEKEIEGITMAARKLTVKRGKTIKAAGFRLSFGDKQPGKMEPCEVFAGALHETLNMIAEEQNFIVHFFHLSSLPSMDFPDLVASAHPEQRHLPDFSAKQPHDPDRRLGRRVEQIMDEIFAFWPVDMQNLVDWALKADPIQGIGILFALEKAVSDLDDTNQDFIIHSLQKIHSRLIGLFNRFVDDQIRGIEDTKVKVNKRKGVISFMRVFPHFSTAVENMLTQPSQEFYDIRINVNDAYDRINRAMWESLKFIAKEAPGQTAGVAATSGDPEDKEVLNYHILLIENMNHYIEEVDPRGLPVLERWRDRAHQDLQEHMTLYLDSVIHRPLGKLLDFVESAERMMSSGGISPSDIASRPSHSRSVAKKVLATYDSKEMRRGIELLKKRVEKHFGDADDPGLSRSLVLKVVRECEGRYCEAHDRTRRVLQAVYEGQLDLDWRKEDAVAMIKR